MFKCFTVPFYERGQLDYSERNLLILWNARLHKLAITRVCTCIEERERGGCRNFFMLMCFVQTCLCRRVIVTAVYTITNCVQFVNNI